MFIENHEEFYHLILEKYKYLFERYNFRIVSDEISYGGLVRSVCLKNDICTIIFYYERDGADVHFIKGKDRYNFQLILLFIDEISYRSSIKKLENKEILYKELFLAFAELLEKAIDVILENFKDENYEEFKRRYEEWLKS